MFREWIIPLYSRCCLLCISSQFFYNITDREICLMFGLSAGIIILLPIYQYDWNTLINISSSSKVQERMAIMGEEWWKHKWPNSYIGANCIFFSAYMIKHSESFLHSHFESSQVLNPSTSHTCGISVNVEKYFKKKKYFGQFEYFFTFPGSTFFCCSLSWIYKE